MYNAILNNKFIATKAGEITVYNYDSETREYISASTEYLAVGVGIGKRDAYQFLGVGEENITLAGVLYPELTGGKLTMTTLRMMAEEGRAWPLLDGTGMIYGMYVISRVSETGSIFFADGTPRKIDFTLSLTRVDESLAALYGDIGKQAESLIGKAGSMATRFTGMTGAG